MACMPRRSIPPVRLWLYGDIGCPWTYLALARIRKLRAESPVVFGWRPLSRFIYADGRESPAGSSPDTRNPLPPVAEFESLGLPFRAHNPDFDSRSALLALEFARDLGQAAFNHTLDGLFAAHFDCLADLSDREALLDVCRDLGLDREALDLSLEDGRYEADLDVAEAEADRYEIEQIPTILVGRLKIVGAAPKDVLANVVSQALATA